MAKGGTANVIPFLRPTTLGVQSLRICPHHSRCPKAQSFSTAEGVPNANHKLNERCDGVSVLVENAQQSNKLTGVTNVETVNLTNANSPRID